MASTSRAPLTCLGCLRASTAAAHQPIASSSRNVIVAAPFSTSSALPYAAPTPEDATARKPPHTAANEGPEPSSSLNSIGRARRTGGGGGGGRTRTRNLPPFEEWMAGDAKNYKQPKPGFGPNWISATPFPLNPAFKPPPPIRSKVKEHIWNHHFDNPQRWTVPALSQKFNIGKERMEAVLRLKALEAEFVEQKIPLQTEFQQRMDRLLGARDFTRTSEAQPSKQSNDNSMRGPQREEFAEGIAPGEEVSVLAPALAESVQQRKDMVAALPSGGPAEAASKRATPRPRTVVNAPTRSGKTTRPSISITNVPSGSYEGAGRLERNQRRAAKRAKSPEVARHNERKARKTKEDAAATGRRSSTVKTVAGEVKKPKQTVRASGQA